MELSPQPPPQRVRFLLCGAQKAGTTALDAYLRLHPQLGFPTDKEPHFFDDESVDWSGDSGVREQRYHDLFQSNDCRGKVWGESTPIYVYWRPSAERIWRYNPAMRLVVLLRNPITRAYSHWTMESRRGHEPLDFMTALQRESVRCQDAAPLQHRIYSYVDRGRYSQQLQRLWSWFERDAVLVLRQEDLQQQPAETLQRVYRHLGVAELPFNTPLQRHVQPYGEPMPAEAWPWLRDCFAAEIAELETLLGWDCSTWLHDPEG